MVTISQQEIIMKRDDICRQLVEVYSVKEQAEKKIDALKTAANVLDQLAIQIKESSKQIEEPKNQ
jgi:hypothetical protein